MTDDGRGILYPARLPTFHREPAPDDLSTVIRWFWVPRWQVAPGRVSRQQLLPFPAGNLVIAPDGMALSGPTSGASHRDLRGTGWAVGALLRPAGLAALHPDPQSLVDDEIDWPAADLLHDVAAAMADPDEDAGRARAIALYTEWAREEVGETDDAGLLANRLEELVAGDPEIIQVAQLADRLGLSTRAVQRITKRHFGLRPLTVIRRYRLGEAARRLREDPALTVARVAADLGYTDQAHLAHDFQNVLGLAPSAYRRER